MELSTEPRSTEASDGQVLGLLQTGLWGTAHCPSYPSSQSLSLVRTDAARDPSEQRGVQHSCGQRDGDWGFPEMPS